MATLPVDCGGHVSLGLLAPTQGSLEVLMLRPVWQAKGVTICVNGVFGVVLSVLHI